MTDGVAVEYLWQAYLKLRLFCPRQVFPLEARSGKPIGKGEADRLIQWMHSCRQGISRWQDTQGKYSLECLEEIPEGGVGACCVASSRIL